MGLNHSKIKHRKKIEKPPIKIALLGDEKVGKTSICSSFLGLEFQDDCLSTFGNEANRKRISLKYGKEMKLIIWDTPGRERFRSAASKLLKSVEGFVLVFDVTNRQSFENLEGWLKIIKENSKKKPIICLFGNKVDVDEDKWTVKKEEIEEFVKIKGLEYYNVSAKNGIGLNEGINYLANKIYDN